MYVVCVGLGTSHLHSAHSAEAIHLRGFRGSDSNAVRLREHVTAISISPRDANQLTRATTQHPQLHLLYVCFVVLCSVKLWHFGMSVIVCGVPEVMLRIEGSRFLRLRASDGLR